MKCTLPSQLGELHCADDLTEKVAQELSLNQDQKNNLAIAVTEAVGNAIIHGNKKDPNKKVHLQFRTGKDKIIITVQDEGEGFDPESIQNPLLPKNLMKESGRGIFILTELMDEVDYQFSKKGTTLKMVMRL
ncbi:ATP-binding protein [bacterium]|nr:ATP-binding protein [bacterium]